MTQKELLYVEDAVMHENNIIAFLNLAIEDAEDESISSFLKSELKKHESSVKSLMKELEGCSK